MAPVKGYVIGSRQKSTLTWKTGEERTGCQTPLLTECGLKPIEAEERQRHETLPFGLANWTLPAPSLHLRGIRRRVGGLQYRYEDARRPRGEETDYKKDHCRGPPRATLTTHLPAYPTPVAAVETFMPGKGERRTEPSL